MTTMAEVQAGALTDEIRGAVVADQFAEDYLLVVENDYGCYTGLMELAEGKTLSQLSDDLRQEWDDLIDQIDQAITEKISPIASDLVRQLIGNLGSRPWDIIAGRVIESRESL